MINLSEAAVQEIIRLRSKYQNPNALFRLKFKSGGCCSFYYIMEFDEQLASNDRVYDCGKVKVVVDSQQLNYLNGLTLDYSEDLMGGGFRFNNPNAKATCGCGNSFSI
ncbi:MULTISPECIES: iron-sulfur cluster assembly accessory protein [unclassified Okeania]|uniref:HesB/IscA family protein n=1 Tax=unclassified Okeania TaxID=2634635 RepID=UPI0013C1579A|nr:MULTISPECIES: iron-sulfur cluster assembly accessory protein [unclassified Okeania]NEN89670.1 iron-sulfur cluster assembly accessory protein [Okeania sp. SIO3H1]NET28216.1 iron-sulfur cluster assembly accessory protein [Okeania sp. SIO1I7]NET41057.1 iron-sulfur cluster assembly accessory protein [Okeania sp. SIO2B3]